MLSSMTALRVWKKRDSEQRALESVGVRMKKGGLIREFRKSVKRKN